MEKRVKSIFRVNNQNVSNPMFVVTLEKADWSYHEVLTVLILSGDEPCHQIITSTRVEKRAPCPNRFHLKN